MSIGEVLGTARAESGLSVEDVSRETRIRGGLIRAIEQDDFAPCGGDVYARGHIRSIAAVVGVDAGPLVAQFDRTHGGAPQPVQNPTPAFDPEVAARTERRRPNWAAAMAAALVAICLVAAVNLIRSSGSDSDRSRNQAGNSDVAQNRSPEPVDEQPTPDVTAPPLALLPPDRVTVQLRLIGSKSWLHVAGADGEPLFEGILTRGALRNFDDPRRIRLTIGNAGAVALVVNGHDFGAAGSDGQVVHRSFGRASTGNAG